jgi:hypothetical protein
MGMLRDKVIAWWYCLKQRAQKNLCATCCQDKKITSSAPCHNMDSSSNRSARFARRMGKDERELRDWFRRRLPEPAMQFPPQTKECVKNKPHEHGSCHGYTGDGIGRIPCQSSTIYPL